ncbi:acyltransferase [Rhodoferax sp.]|uniref:acyltransferase family protein n=1 Tax=Rhodoferax sp. TaxID=50421 RepID=UPI0025E451D7|nr:acyltransferase [Rhodoferax sp.]
MRTVQSAVAHPKNNFDAVRLIAALCVLFSHQLALGNLPEPRVLVVHTLGGVGVLVFFSISGFLVARSWNADPHIGRFAAKRLLRIWPGFAVVILLTACVLGPLVSPLSIQDYFTDIGFWRYFKNLLFKLQEVLPINFDGSPYPHSANGSLWTLPMELQCYLVLGLFGIVDLMLHRWRWLLMAVMLAVTVVYMVIPAAGEDWNNPWSWSRGCRDFLEFGMFFMAGGLFAVFRMHESPCKARWMLAACWVLGAAAVAANCNLLALWLVVPTTAVMISNASTPGLRRAGRFGNLSYGMYIYAFPVQQTLIWLYRDTLSWQTLLGLALAITLTLAFASWHLVEKRALQWKPRRAYVPA